MCGIIGGISHKKFNSKNLLKTIGHRGPDNNGFFIEGESVSWAYTPINSRFVKQWESANVF